MTTGSLLMLRGSKVLFCNHKLKMYTSAIKRKKHYGIAIVGGGLVGMAMACAIAKNKKLSEKSIVLFESSSEKISLKKSPIDDYSNRVVSLTPGTKNFFESLGIWKDISGVRYKTVKKLQVWDACSDALITFNDDLINDVSYIVENDVILYSLNKICSDLKQIEVKYKSKMKQITLPTSHKPVSIELENGDKYTCDLLIGADGANSQVRQLMGVRYLSWNYDQKGVVATLKLSEPTENIVAWQRFLPTGPVALLPLTNELSSLVWSTETKQADELLRMSDETFVDAVNDAFWKMYPKNDLVMSALNSLDKVLDSLMLKSNSVRQLPPSVSAVLPKSRAAFPLGFGHSSKYVNWGVVLIGDAAHRVHPLAGQGVNLGFKDAEVLTAKLAESVYEGNKLGAIRALADYESQRQKQLVPMLVAIDVLQKLYSTTLTPVVLLRSLGLQFTNSLSPVKTVSDSSAMYSRNGSLIVGKKWCSWLVGIRYTKFHSFSLEKENCPVNKEEALKLFDPTEGGFDSVFVDQFSDDDVHLVKTIKSTKETRAIVETEIVLKIKEMSKMSGPFFQGVFFRTQQFCIKEDVLRKITVENIFLRPNI